MTWACTSRDGAAPSGRAPKSQTVSAIAASSPPIVASHLAVNASQSMSSSSLPWRLARFASSVMNSISRAFGSRPYFCAHWRASAAALRVTACARVEYASSVCCAMPSISCPRPSSRLRTVTPNSRASAE